MRLLAAAAAALALLAAACASAEPNRPAAVRAGGDWTRFGYDAARRNAGPGNRLALTSAAYRVTASIIDAFSSA